jgi:hypothetical protein
MTLDPSASKSALRTPIRVSFRQGKVRMKQVSIPRSVSISVGSHWGEGFMHE